MSLAIFTPAAGDIRDTLPVRLPKDNPASEVSILCEMLGAMLDELAAAVEQIHADQTLQTASQAALQAEWAVLYGAANEQLPPTVNALRAYLIQRASEDGTVGACELTLLSILMASNTGFPGTVGLIFPTDGSGLIFPADGSGLDFPAGGWLAVIDHPAANYLEIRVLDTLVYDTAAFARAVKRFEPAHYLPSVITVTPTP